MAKVIEKLTADDVERLTEPGRYGDGLGLELQISKWGTKAWIFRYTLDAKTRYLGLGPTHTVSLKEARVRAREARQLLLDGKDPVEAKHEARDTRRAQANERMPFKEAATRFIELHAPTWKNEKHRTQWPNTLAQYAYPRIGSRPVSAIDGALITETLAPIWQTKHETASRVKQRIERVVQWVKEGMPMPPQTGNQRGHHPALPYEQTPEFMSDLQQRESISARALELTVLCCARTGDTIGAKWDEVDLDNGLWRIAEKTDDKTGERIRGHKTGKTFEIPLPARAVEILKALPREKGNAYVFIGGKSGSGLSNGAMAELLKGMHKARKVAGLPAWTDRDSGRLAVPHGFRSTFRDWAGDRSNFPREVIEAAMSHQIKDRSEASYRRMSALEKRRLLMTEWANYCESPPLKGANVVALHG
jgi:integrase